jgi:hypothetical protein
MTNADFKKTIVLHGTLHLETLYGTDLSDDRLPRAGSLIPAVHTPWFC